MGVSLIRKDVHSSIYIYILYIPIDIYRLYYTYYIVLCLVILYYIVFIYIIYILYYILPYHIELYYILAYHIILYDLALYYFSFYFFYFVISYYFILCHIMLYYMMLYYHGIFYCIIYYILLCYIILCNIIMVYFIICLMIFTCMCLFPIFRWYLECLGAKDKLDSMKWVRDLYLLAPAVHGNRVTWSNSRKGSLQAEFFNDSDGSRWYKKLRHRFRVAARWIWRRCQSYRRRCKNVSYKVLNFFLSCWWCPKKEDYDLDKSLAQLNQNRAGGCLFVRFWMPL